MPWNWQLLRHGTFWLDAGSMFGVIPKVVWTRWLTPDDKNRMPLQQNSLLLERDGRLVLIEAGIGDKLGDKERAIYSMDDRAVHDSLADIKVDPADVSAVILSHLHFDHAGGITRKGPSGKPVLTFPNAEIIVQRQEWEDAIANRSTMHKTYLRDHLTDEVAERVRLVEGEGEVLPGVSVIPVPGHTWGQQAVTFTDPGNRTICFVPDVMPTSLHVRPSANLAYDVETFTSMESRSMLLTRAVEGEWVICPVHDPGDNPLFTVSDDPERPGNHVLEPFTRP